MDTRGVQHYGGSSGDLSCFSFLRVGIEGARMAHFVAAISDVAVVAETSQLSEQQDGEGVERCRATCPLLNPARSAVVRQSFRADFWER